jgi:undecaprenyl diphosphate synthase
LILDGNRRWAKENGMPTLRGHQKGYDNLTEIAKHAILDQKIPFVSAYMFSVENWKRAEEEVGYLMKLASKMANRDAADLHEKNIRVLWLGSDRGISDDLKKSIEKAVEQTKNNTAGTLGLCFNYGGRQEIVDAVNKIDGEVTEEAIAKNLYGPEIPDIDLLIRTSGEQRISGFMLWRMAYSEMLFVDKYWPDFSNNDLDLAISDYNRRKRRYGK